MAVVKDWVVSAVDEIFDGVDEVDLVDEHIAETKERSTAIIVRHSPFIKGVAYMPVPRCETCKHWDKDDLLDAPFGECLLLQHGNYARNLGISRLAIADFQVDAEPDFITQASFGCVQWEKRP